MRASAECPDQGLKRHPCKTGKVQGIHSEPDQTGRVTFSTLHGTYIITPAPRDDCAGKPWPAATLAWQQRSDHAQLLPQPKHPPCPRLPLFPFQPLNPYPENHPGNRQHPSLTWLAAAGLVRVAASFTSFANRMAGCCTPGQRWHTSAITHGVPSAGQRSPKQKDYSLTLQHTLTTGAGSYTSPISHPISKLNSLLPSGSGSRPTPPSPTPVAPQTHSIS